ncbi:MAG: hypothetical protein F4Y03_08350 [Alphaproteobacteria bacterium]|nr:hypothetical protein [Alphaproteobacteria bacterium]
MRKPASMKGLEELGRKRLSQHFFMRDMLYSEIANFHRIQNIPDDPDLAIAVGVRLCEELLEPLHATFGHVSIRSAYRSVEVNTYGSENKHNCASSEKNRSRHIWDRKDSNGRIGATACVVIPWFVDYLDNRPDMSWKAMAWWVHDHLPYSEMVFYPKYAAFNLRWHETEKRREIYSHTPPKGCLTKPSKLNYDESHASEYPGFPKLGRPNEFYPDR